MLRRWAYMQWLFPFRRSRRFAALLGRPGFNPLHVLREIEGAIEHGPVGEDPKCRGDAGVLALLVGRELGWVVPPGPIGDCAGWSIAAAWITRWALDGDQLAIEYHPPPTLVHQRGSTPVETRPSEPQVLRITSDPAELVAFVRRAARVLRRSRRYRRAPHSRSPSSEHEPVAMVPVPANDASVEDIFRFAMRTYSGYERHGGFDPLGERANRMLARWQADAVLPVDVDDLRGALFFEARRWRHFGELPDGEDEKYIRALLAQLRTSSGGFVPEDTE
jgi:hypothetical protein